MNLYELTMESITGERISFAEYRDAALLIVNLASQCGLTPQYAGLRALHETGRVTVLGFPCNQFGAQEPGTNAEILEFARSRYEVDFPIFAKIEVNGEGACDLYAWLKTEQPNDDGSTDIPWNFTKFLINRAGKVAKRFGPRTTPEEISAELDTHL